MKHHRIFHALTNIKEEYITEAAPPARPKRQWWKAGIGLAACLCLVVAAAMTIPFGGSGGDSCSQEPPAWAYNLTASPEGDYVYFCYEDAVYRHSPKEQDPDLLAEFRGTFRQTETGLYCIDEASGDVYRVEGTQLDHLGSIPVNGDLFQFIGHDDETIYWSLGLRGNEVYATSCTDGQTDLLFTTPVFGYSYPPYHQHMAGGSIYFMNEGFLLQRYDLETGEVSTVYDRFWSMKAEPWSWFFYEDFVLCYCIQYAANDQGTHDQVGHPFYVLPYDGSDAYYLTDCTNYNADPVYVRDTLYYQTILDVYASQRDVLPVACNPVTGELTTLAEEELAEYADSIAIVNDGLYYTADYDLWYYDFGTAKSTCILTWEG